MGKYSNLNSELKNKALVLTLYKTKQQLLQK
jgi:hypothetical protein